MSPQRVRGPGGLGLPDRPVAPACSVAVPVRRRLHPAGVEHERAERAARAPVSLRDRRCRCREVLPVPGPTRPEHRRVQHGTALEGGAPRPVASRRRGRLLLSL